MLTAERKNLIREESEEFCAFGHTDMLKELLDEIDRLEGLLARPERNETTLATAHVLDHLGIDHKGPKDDR